MIDCCIGIMAFNEAANIGLLLEALLDQRLEKVRVAEIVVVASGCTDNTDKIALAFRERDPRVKLLTQSTRQGKASALNFLLNNTSQEIIVMESADTMPEPETIEHLVSPLASPQIGMTGGRPVPTNDPRRFMGFTVHLLWELHHQLSLRTPKMGELIAFRRCFRQIPHDSAVDEVSIELLILGQGLKLRYVPEAIVYNKGPETVRDFLKQRRRIFAGHLHVKNTLGYKASTMNSLYILWLLLSRMRLDWRYFLWGPATIFLEVLGRSLGVYDYVVRKRNPFVWPVAESTKELSGL